MRHYVQAKHVYPGTLLLDLETKRFFLCVSRVGNGSIKTWQWYTWPSNSPNDRWMIVKETHNLDVFKRFVSFGSARSIEVVIMSNKQETNRD